MTCVECGWYEHMHRVECSAYVNPERPMISPAEHRRRERLGLATWPGVA
jgi:hypothetical protein